MFLIIQGLLLRHPCIKVDQNEQKISLKFLQKLTRDSYNLKVLIGFSNTSNEIRILFPNPCCSPFKKKLFRSTTKKTPSNNLFQKVHAHIIIWNTRYKAQFCGLYRLCMWTIVVSTGAQNPWGDTPPLTTYKTSQTNTPQSLSFLLLRDIKT